MTKVQTEEGAEHILLECAYKNGHTETLYVNPASYFVEKSMAMRMNPATQAMEELLMTFGDYQMLDGVAIPNGDALYPASVKFLGPFCEAHIAKPISVSRRKVNECEPWMTQNIVQPVLWWFVGEHGVWRAIARFYRPLQRRYALRNIDIAPIRVGETRYPVNATVMPVRVLC